MYRHSHSAQRFGFCVTTFCSPFVFLHTTHATALSMVQVEVRYQPPMTLSTQAAEVTGEAAITVIGGPAHAPFLPAHAVTGRSCFNVGPAAQRAITPTAPLTLVDRSVHQLCHQTCVEGQNCWCLSLIFAHPVRISPHVVCCNAYSTVMYPVQLYPVPVSWALHAHHGGMQ